RWIAQTCVHQVLPSNGSPFAPVFDRSTRDSPQHNKHDPLPASTITTEIRPRDRTWKVESSFRFFKIVQIAPEKGPACYGRAGEARPKDETIRLKGGRCRHFTAPLQLPGKSRSNSRHAPPA